MRRRQISPTSRSSIDLLNSTKKKALETYSQQKLGTKTNNSKKTNSSTTVKRSYTKEDETMGDDTKAVKQTNKLFILSTLGGNTKQGSGEFKSMG